jgi:signal transduction histidine kinase
VTASNANWSNVVVVVAPTGADAKNIGAVLKSAGVRATTGKNAAEAATWVDGLAGALVMTEEALSPRQNPDLVAAFDRQPPWSDIPLIIVASTQTIHRWASVPAAVFGLRSNVSLVARPLQSSTLVAAVKNALRARHHQFALRDILHERDSLLVSLETRVQQRTAKLQELLAELESFSYSVSHDLRAPLRIMAGYARVILDESGHSLAPDVRHYVERIAHSAERMDLLTQDVLAYTRVARGEIELGPVDVEKVVEEAIEQYPQFATARSMIVVRTPLASVIAHGPSLVQALANILGNALKFARPGVTLRIEIWTKVHAGRVQIMIKDNGAGVAAAHHDRIFRIFERAVGQEVPGTGIGLAIVKKAAERMGGRVGVTSRLGRGSTFWLELPKGN